MEARFYRKDDGSIWLKTGTYQGTSFEGRLATYADPAGDSSSDPDSDHASKFSTVHTAVKSHDHRFSFEREWKAFLASEVKTEEKKVLGVTEEIENVEA